MGLERLYTNPVENVLFIKPFRQKSELLLDVILSNLIFRDKPFREARLEQSIARLSVFGWPGIIALLSPTRYQN
jgi:hypothetical protein